MTGEEMERAIDFLLKSQANLEQRIEQVNTALGERIEQVNSNLGLRIEETNKLLGEFAQTQNEFMQTVTRTFEAQAEINKRTDERINMLVGTVERIISERRDGGESKG